MANDYTTSTDAFADMPDSGYASTDYPIMATMITAASRLIDGEFGRWPGFFNPSTSDEVRYYDGSGEEAQVIDEYATITSVAVSEQGETCSTGYTAWGSTDYYVWPYNLTPIKKLIIDSNGSKMGWYSYNKAVKVTGVPGYATTTPAVISQACKVQAIRLFMRAKQGYQDTSAGEQGGTTLKGQTQLDPDVKAMLFPLKLELS